MHIESDKDFPQIRKQYSVWRKRFSMFTHDVKQIEHIIEQHIQDHSIALMYHRQTKQKRYLELAQQHIDEINRVINTVEKIELMAMLSRS